MQKLNLDFQQSPDQPSRLAGWLLFLVGLAMFMEIGVSYDRLLNDRRVLDKEIKGSKLEFNMTRRESAHPQYAEKDFEEARQVIGRLTTPWEAFFAGLESIKGKKVAVLSIEPDMQTGILRIEGEAKDYPAVLTFISQLRMTKPFSAVFMTHHEIKRDDPQHPVSFTLSMRWVKTS